MKKFFSVGHIVNELEPQEHLSGPAVNAVVCANNMGLEAHLITKCWPFHPYLGLLERAGILVHNIQDRNDRYSNSITTTLTIPYDPNNIEMVLEVQEEISKEDLNNFPEIPEGSFIFLAPQIDGEINENLYEPLSKKGTLIVQARDFLPAIENGYRLTKTVWTNHEQLGFAQIAILSEKNQGEQSLLTDLKKTCPTVLVTKPSDGLTVYEKENDLEIDIKAFPQDEVVKDLPPIEECCAVGFATYSEWGGNSKASGIFASILAGVKIKKSRLESGIRAIPGIDEVLDFIQNHQREYKSFLRENNVPNLLMLEGLQGFRFKEY